MNVSRQLQIHQTPALIGIDADLGQQSIHQQPAELNFNTDPGKVTIHQYAPKLNIDSTRAREAITGGSVQSMNDRIYSGIQQLFLEGLARRMEQGSRLAAIHVPGNTIAEIIGTDNEAVPFPETRGPASSDNIDVTFDVRPPDISVSKAESRLEVKINKPEIGYQRGKLDIYMRQYNSIEFTPPQLDLLH